MTKNKNVRKSASTRNWVPYDCAEYLFEGSYTFRVRRESTGGGYYSILVYLEILTTMGWQKLWTRSGGDSWTDLHVEKTEAELKACADFLIDNNAQLGAPAQPRK